MDVQTFGAFIQSRRKKLGMTQGDLGAKLNVTDKAISRWERGIGFPDIKLLEPLAEALELTIEELMRCERTKPDLISGDLAEKTTETKVTPIKETWLSKYHMVFALLCYLGYTLLYRLSNSLQFAEVWDSLIPVKNIFFLATVAAFIYASYKEGAYGVD